jgi:hypothetical protein
MTSLREGSVRAIAQDEIFDRESFERDLTIRINQLMNPLIIKRVGRVMADLIIIRLHPDKPISGADFTNWPQWINHCCL